MEIKLLPIIKQLLQASIECNEFSNVSVDFSFYGITHQVYLNIWKPSGGRVYSREIYVSGPLLKYEGFSNPEKYLKESINLLEYIIELETGESRYEGIETTNSTPNIGTASASLET